MKVCKLILVIIPVSLILICCKDNSSHHYIPLDSKPDLPRSDTSKPDITTIYRGKEYPAIFEAAFVNGTKSKQDDFILNFYTSDIGNINIESGKIIACDPVTLRDALPFAYEFPIGSFPVQLGIAKAENDQRVAFSRIVFSQNRVAKWEVALKAGQKPLLITDSTIYCYGVDAGEGLFIDSIGAPVINQLDESQWGGIFINKYEVAEDANGFIYQFGNHSLASFSTGMGDGCYSTYIGLDSVGKPCRLLTDFGLVDWWKLR
ncbi:MAG: DUF4241 domain-containing protein [Chitinophagaceae bacterium]